MLGKIEGRRRRGRQKMRWLDGITDSVDTNLGVSSLLGLTVFHLLGMSKDYGADYSKDHEGSSCSGVNKSLMVTSRNLIHLVIGRASHNRK